MRARRFLLVPDVAAQGATITSVATATGDPAEGGRSVRQPLPNSDNPPGGDLRPVVTGTPEEDAVGRLAVVIPGTSGAARFGFTRDASTSLQLRQQPSVLTHPDLLDRQAGEFLGGFREYLVRPKSLSLRSGKLLTIWVRQARKTEDMAQGVGVQTLWLATMDSAGAWTAPYAPSGVWWGQGGIVGEVDNELFDYAIVQYPDTDELVMVMVSTEHSFLGTIWDRRLTVLVSDSDGLGWTVKASHVMKGSSPDIAIGADGSALLACTAQVLASGRLMVGIVTQKGIYTLVSDDRGATFRKGAQAMNIPVAMKGVSESNHPDIDYAGMTSTMLENGLCWLVAAIPLDNDNKPFTSGVFGWVTADGVNLGARQDLGNGGGTLVYTVQPAVAVRDDGWPMLFVQGHSFYVPSSGSVYNDLLCCRTLAKRDPGMDDTVAELLPSMAAIGADYSGGEADPNFWALTPFHGVKTTTQGTGDLGNTAIIRNSGYAGGLSVCRHRGALWVSTAWMLEYGSGSGISLYEAGLTVARANNWQPLQECLGFGWKLKAGHFGAIAGRETTWGRSYHLTHDCQGYPGVWGWQVDQDGGDATLVPVGEDDERSYTKIEGELSYYRTDLPNHNGEDADLEDVGVSARVSGVARFWVDVQSGGSATACHIGGWLRLVAGSYAYGMEIRLHRKSSTLVTVLACSPFTKDIYGQKDLIASAGQFIEILFAVDGDGTITGSCYARTWVPEDDPDFLCDYSQICDVAISPYTGASEGDEEFRWGNPEAGSTTAHSRWKLAALHRPDTIFEDSHELPTKPLEIRTHEWDGDRTTVPIYSALIQSKAPVWYLDRNDSGFVNLMRCPQATTRGQHIERGLLISWRGDAATRGSYVYRTGYDYAAANALPGGSGKPWRVPVTNTARYVPDTSIVLDAGALGWKLDAIAVFGRTWPNLRIDLHTTNVWSSPLKTVWLGLPLYNGDDAGLEEWHRSLADWLVDPAIANRHFSFNNRIASLVDSTTKAVATDAWRPHQWYSHPLGQGPQHYLAIRAESAVIGGAPLNQARVFRILDNDAGRLYLEDTPLTYWPTWNSLGVGENERAAIFSDRFAFSLGDWTTTRYRYMRITMLAHWRSGQETFASTRRIIPGRLADLSASDFEWGWGWKVDPGVSVRGLPGGGSVVTETRPSLRQFTCEYNQRRFQGGPSAIGAPSVTPTGTWHEIVDLLARTRHGAELCALIWQGERALPLANITPFTKSYDPMDSAGGPELFLVRTDGHDLRQAAWQCAQQPVPGVSTAPAVASVARPWMAVRSITFDEEA